MTKYRVTLVDEQGIKRTFIMNENMWMTRENFSGMGKFQKLKIKKIEEKV
jgi:hypothetical protein